MPPIVKLCYRELRKHANGHPVVLITSENYLDYIELPDYVLDKVRNKQISITHLSDIIRVSLLFKHGGIWVDSTVLLTKDIDGIVPVRQTFYSYKHSPNPWNFNVVNGAWTTFFIAAAKGNEWMGLMREVFLAYWKRHTVLVEYFLMDYVFAWMLRHRKDLQQVLNNLPTENEDMFDLMDELDTPYDANRLSALLERTKINKLTYKRKFLMQTPDGKPTCHGYLLHHFG